MKKKKKEKIKQDKKTEELENQLKTALSDYQNLKRDLEKRLDFEEKMIRRSLVRGLIDLADDIDVAMDRVQDEKGWREGIAQILNKFYGVINEMGAEAIDVKKGDKFDSEKHEAVGTVEEGEPGTVADVVQNGYMLEDVVIRPSRVIVVKKSEK